MANIIQQFKNANGDNIYPIAYAQGGCKMDLLWTNPSPTSNFAEQTVSLDLSGYSFVLITARTRSDIEITPIQLFLVDGVASRLTNVLTGTNACYTRDITVSQNGVLFGTGYYGTSENNGYAIPYKIYGIKMSYVVPTNVQGLQYVEVEE